MQLAAGGGHLDTFSHDVARDADSGLFVAEAEDGRVAGWVRVLGRRFLEFDAYAAMRVRSNTVRAEARLFCLGLGIAIAKTQNVFVKAVERSDGP